MQFEVEKKFWVNGFDRILSVLQELDAPVDDGVDQIDKYFTHPARDFTVTDEVLRLRSVGDSNCVTYKGARIDPSTKTRHELEIPLLDGAHTVEQFTELLTLLGFAPLMTVRKHRRKGICQWEGICIEVCLDEIDQLGQFVELEATSDARGIDAAKAKLANLAKRLDLTRSERRSYVELLRHELSPGHFRQS